MSRSCSQCGNNGHNSRTCPTDVTAGDDCGEKGIMLFGVRVTEASSSCFRKSVSMNNLSQFDHVAQDSNPVEDGGYASDDVVHASGRSRERKRGTPWTEDEHRLFLTGLHKVGKGDWRGISRNFVKTRTPTQVASHAQKYFLRRTNQNRRRRRSSLFDITPDSFIGTSTEEKTPLERITDGSEKRCFPAIGDHSMKGSTLGSRNTSSKLICPVPAPIPIPPSRKMANLKLNKKTSATPEIFPLSLNLPTQSPSSSSSSNDKQTRGSRGSVFETMSSNGDSIMGVA